MNDIQKKTYIDKDDGETKLAVFMQSSSGVVYREQWQAFDGRQVIIAARSLAPACLSVGLCSTCNVV